MRLTITITILVGLTIWLGLTFVMLPRHTSDLHTSHLKASPEQTLPSHLPSLAAPSLATHLTGHRPYLSGIPTFSITSHPGNLTGLVVIHGSYSAWDGYILSEWFDILSIIESKGAKVHPGGASSWEDLEAGLVAGFGRLPDAIIMVEQFHLIGEWGPRER
jgi:hypothetical protein